MFRDLAIEVEPGIDPRTRDTYIKAYNRFSQTLIPRFDAVASYRLACFQAVNLWKTFQPAYEPLQFGDLLLTFDRDVEDVLGMTEYGQEVLAIKDPTSEAVLTVDVAGYLFGFGKNKIPAAIGGRRFTEQAYTRFYGEKYKGIQVIALRQDSNFRIQIPSVAGEPV